MRFTGRIPILGDEVVISFPKINLIPLAAQIVMLVSPRDSDIYEPARNLLAQWKGFIALLF